MKLTGQEIELVEYKLTKQEIELVEYLRIFGEEGPLQFTATLENGVWECTLTTAHIDEAVRRRVRPASERVLRGVGASFVEAFSSLDANDIEPVEDACS